MKLFAFLIPVLLFGFFTLVPAVTHAADFTLSPSFHIIPEECHCPQSAPDFGCVLAVIQNVMNFAISIGFIIFIFVLSYAGFLFMTNPTNSHAREQGNHMITNAVVGLLIALSAWLIVDFVMKTLYNQATFGPWNSILTTKTDGTELGAEAHCIKVVTPPAGAAGTQTSNNGNGGVTTSTGSSNGGTTGSAATCTRPDNGTVANGGCCQGNANACQTGLTCDTTTNRCKAADTTTTGTATSNWQSYFGFQSGISAQAGQASGALSGMLSCMATKLSQAGHTNVSQISSISDSLIVSGAKTWEQCKNGECQHCGGTGSNRCSAGGGASYHYGGTQCGNASSAVDFAADTGTTAGNLLTQAAQQCGGRIVAEGNHTHVQIGSCN